jgi:dephospho-CoA kinase
VLKIGLTGGIGCGKSTVSALFEALKVPVIDADIIARQLVSETGTTLSLLAQIFGVNILNADQTLNRGRLKSIVFSNLQKKNNWKPFYTP